MLVIFPLAIPAVPDVDPNKWADAIIKVIRGGGWIFAALVALFIVMRWWPGRRAKDS